MAMDVSIIDGLSGGACTIVNCSPSISSLGINSFLAREKTVSTSLSTLTGVTNMTSSWDATDHNTGTATGWGLLVRIDIVGLSRHKFIINLAWCLASFKATVLEYGIVDGWWFTWWFEFTSLWVTLNPFTTFAMELPDIGPSSRDIVSIALANQGTLVDAGQVVLFTNVLGVGSFRYFAFFIPFAAALVPNSAHRIAAHFASWWPQFMISVTSHVTTVHHFALHTTFAADLTIGWRRWTIASGVEDALDLILPVSITIVAGGSGADGNTPSAELILGIVGVHIAWQVGTERESTLGRVEHGIISSVSIIGTAFATTGDLFVVVLARHAILRDVTITGDTGPLGAIGWHCWEEVATLADSFQIVGHGPMFLVAHNHAFGGGLAFDDIALHPAIWNVHFLITTIRMLLFGLLSQESWV